MPTRLAAGGASSGKNRKQNSTRLRPCASIRCRQLHLPSGGRGGFLGNSCRSWESRYGCPYRQAPGWVLSPGRVHNALLRRSCHRHIRRTCHHIRHRRIPSTSIESSISPDIPCQIPHWDPHRLGCCKCIALLPSSSRSSCHRGHILFCLSPNRSSERECRRNNNPSR